MRRRIFSSTFAIAMVFNGFAALAEEAELPAENRGKLSDTTQKLNVVPGAEVVDDMITNNNLRALSGSLSRWSIASQFNYNGGTIDEPLSQDRPDISGASGTTTKSDLDGSISTKYNIDGKNSLMAGFGIRWIAPFSSGNLKNYDGTPFDAMNPYIQYQYIYKALGIQNVVQVGVMQWTQADQTAVGYGQQFSIDQESIYQVGKSRLSFGTTMAVQYQLFNKSGAYGSPNDPNYIPDVASVQSVYAFTLAPIVEYQLSNKINLRTLVNVWTYEHYASSQSPTDLIHDAIYQSIGVGVSVTRDIFLYPNVQFLPGDIASNLTNVGLAATINMF